MLNSVIGRATVTGMPYRRLRRQRETTSRSFRRRVIRSVLAIVFALVCATDTSSKDSLLLERRCRDSRSLDRAESVLANRDDTTVIDAKRFLNA